MSGSTVNSCNDQIQVCVQVPYHQYELFRQKKYTLWLMPKNQLIGRQDYNTIKKHGLL